MFMHKTCWYMKQFHFLIGSLCYFDICAFMLYLHVKYGNSINVHMNVTAHSLMLFVTLSSSGLLRWSENTCGGGTASWGSDCVHTVNILVIIKKIIIYHLFQGHFTLITNTYFSTQLAIQIFFVLMCQGYDTVLLSIKNNLNSEDTLKTYFKPKSVTAAFC